MSKTRTSPRVGSAKDKRTAQPNLTHQAMAIHRRTGCEVGTLRTNYITPGTVNIPNSSTAFAYRKSNGYSPRNRVKPEEEEHYPVLLSAPPPHQHGHGLFDVDTDDGVSTSSVGAPPSPAPVGQFTDRRAAVLDGFKMLEATGMGFPEDGRAAILSDKSLNGVVTDDLSFFTGLLKLDVSENKLKLADFSVLPRLKELRIACNMIRNVRGLAQLGGFARLYSLDLSYNALTAESIRELYILPSLRELDLCGNELRELPPDFHRFATLEKVLLEHNMIKDNIVFDILSRVPRLRDVTLAYNSLTSVPMRVSQEGSFKFLESLSLAFNFFSTDESVEGVVRLPRMLLLMLYGNPLLGPTGEDPSGAYVQDLVDLSDDLERKKFPNRHLKILSSVPRKIGSINHNKPKNTYEDIDLVKVPNSFEPKLNREYRQTGSETIFAAAYKKAKMSRLESVPLPEEGDEDMAFPVSTTFLTTGYTGPDMAGVESIAGDVMNKVVNSLGLNSATSLYDMQDAAASFMRLRVDDEEAVPHDLFGRDMETSEDVNCQSAIRALKFALKHPLTNDRVVKIGNYARPTAATIGQQHKNKNVAARQALKRSQSLSESAGDQGDVALEDGGLFSVKVPAGSKTNVDTAVTNKLYSHGFSRARTKKYSGGGSGVRAGGDVEGSQMNITLQQIEEVLDGLNDGEVGDVVLTEQHGGGGANNNERISPNSRAMRQSMKRMDLGIKKLIRTANAVAVDLDDD